MSTNQDAYADRRAHPRRKILETGRVIFDDSQSMIDCSILDISEGGAKLEFPNRQVLPRTFVLQLGDGSVTRCEVRWAKDNYFGVRFLDDDE